MGPYSKEQLEHLDLPDEFRCNYKPPISMDHILLAITIFYLLENNKENPINNNV